MSDPETSTSQFASALTESERAMRDRFVEQYIEDFNAIDSLIRCGYTAQYAKDYAPKFMSEPYTLNRIKARQLEIGVTTDAEIHKRRVISALYREANSMFNSGSARVSALRSIADIVGIVAPVKSEANVNVNSTGVDLSHIPVSELEAIKARVYGSKPAPSSTVH
jgi:hypothetical protein